MGHTALMKTQGLIGIRTKKQTLTGLYMLVMLVKQKLNRFVPIGFLFFIKSLGICLGSSWL